jgi:hypothetical protein
MPLCKYYVLGKQVSPPPPGGGLYPLKPSPKLRSPPGGPLPSKPKLPLSLISIAYHFFLLFLTPRSRQAEEYYGRIARGKTRIEGAG